MRTIGCLLIFRIPLSRAPLIYANFALIMKNLNKEYLSDEGYELIGSAFEVHREIGGELSEDEARTHYSVRWGQVLGDKIN